MNEWLNIVCRSINAGDNLCQLLKYFSYHLNSCRSATVMLTIYSVDSWEWWSNNTTRITETLANCEAIENAGIKFVIEIKMILLAGHVVPSGPNCCIHTFFEWLYHQCISWFPGLRFCGRYRNIKFYSMITIAIIRPIGVQQVMLYYITHLL